jgi:sulfur relay (sulfurtransferase) complex TusBCD TusD component (DsrE family)
MKIAVVISSDDAETAWNALRYACFAREKNNAVQVFLLGRGVECESIDTERFTVTEQLRRFAGLGGSIYACGTCLKHRQREATEFCPVSTIADLHQIISESDKILTF